MSILENIIITHIKQPVVVYSPKGRYEYMSDRSHFGISFCMSGKITYTMNGKKFISDENSVVFHPKGSSYTLCGDKEGYFPVINFECKNLHIDELIVFHPNNAKECIKEFERLKNTFLQGESRLEMFSILYKLLNKISAVKNTKHEPLENITRYIKANISDSNLSNENLAQQIGISEVYFRKLFLSCYGVTPKQYILNFRIEKAKHLLTDTQNSVTKISEMCGFSSPYHFCRAFKKRIGLTPTQYSLENKIYKI